MRFARDGYSIVLIGHKDHDEVIGTLGEVPDRSYLVETVEDVDRLELPDPARVRYLTQTTLSLDETRDIISPPERALSVDSRARRRRISATPPRTGRWRSRRFRECVRPAAGGGFAKQLELQTAGGSGRQFRRQSHLVNDRARRRSGLAGRA